MNEDLLARLVCPVTRTPLRWDSERRELVSDEAGLAFPVRGGIPGDAGRRGSDLGTVNAQADLDLSGRWTGIFNYPTVHPPNGFEAVLTDLGGAVSGTISEVDDDPNGVGGTLISLVEGQRQGSAVTFAKIYEDADRMPEPVFYIGTIQPDGNEIAGRWEIPGHWSGTFLMIRDSGVAEAVEEGRRRDTGTEFLDRQPPKQ